MRRHHQGATGINSSAQVLRVLDGRKKEGPTEVQAPPERLHRRQVVERLRSRGHTHGSMAPTRWWGPWTSYMEWTPSPSHHTPSHPVKASYLGPHTGTSRANDGKRKGETSQRDGEADQLKANRPVSGSIAQLLGTYAHMTYRGCFSDANCSVPGTIVQPPGTYAAKHSSEANRSVSGTIAHLLGTYAPMTSRGCPADANCAMSETIVQPPATKA